MKSNPFQPSAARVLVAHSGRLRLILRSKYRNDRNDTERQAKPAARRHRPVDVWNQRASRSILARALVGAVMWSPCGTGGRKPHRRFMPETGILRTPRVSDSPFVSHSAYS